MQKTGEDKVFDVVNHIFIVTAFFLLIYPLIYVVSSSFSSPKAILAGKIWLFPVDPSVEGYKTVLENRRIWLGYGNTFFYTLFGTTVNVVLTVLLAYPLSRRDFVGRNAIMFAVTFTLLFSGGIIATFIVVKSVGIYNTRLAMILPSAISAWNLIITRTYFQATIPTELLEASRMDGCGNIKFLVSVVIPLSGPMLAVITLFYAVYHWNVFFSALIYLRDNELYPLQIILRSILLQNQTDEMLADIESLEHREFLEALLKYSLIVVSIVPVLIMYPFVQRFFVKGVMVGSIKG